VHFEIYVVHTPTNALLINLVNSFKFTLKYTIISLLHVSVFNDHHQGALSVPSYIYVKTLGKIVSYILGDVAACRRAAYVLCAEQSHSALHTTHMPLYDMLLHHLIYIYNDVILPSVLT